MAIGLGCHRGRAVGGSPNETLSFNNGRKLQSPQLESEVFFVYMLTVHKLNFDLCWSDSVGSLSKQPGCLTRCLLESRIINQSLRLLVRGYVYELRVWWL